MVFFFKIKIFKPYLSSSFFANQIRGLRSGIFINFKSSCYLIVEKLMWNLWIIIISDGIHFVFISSSLTISTFVYLSKVLLSHGIFWFLWIGRSVWIRLIEPDRQEVRGINCYLENNGVSYGNSNPNFFSVDRKHLAASWDYTYWLYSGNINIKTTDPTIRLIAEAPRIRLIKYCNLLDLFYSCKKDMTICGFHKKKPSCMKSYW